MQSDYIAFVNRMIDRYEGGYCWDSGDPGGPTNFGITCYDLAAHRGQKMTSMSRWAPLVRAMSRQEADDIYASKYAVKDRFNDLPPGLDCAVLDYGVNSGTVRPLHVLQTIFHRPIGNVFDDALVAACNAGDAAVLVNALCDERMRFLRQLPIWPKFGRGWTSRVVDLRAYSLALAHNRPTPAPKAVPDTMPPTVAAPLVAVAAATPAPEPPAGVFSGVEAWFEGLIHPTGKGVVHPAQLLDDGFALPVHPEDA